MAQFKVGDVVTLKSGGPIMTVDKIAGEQVSCRWFDDKKELKAAVFTADTLQPAKAGNPGIVFG